MIRSSPFPTARNGSLVSMLPRGCDLHGNLGAHSKCGGLHDLSGEAGGRRLQFGGVEDHEYLGSKLQICGCFTKKQKDLQIGNTVFSLQWPWMQRFFWMHGPGFLNTQSLGHVTWKYVGRVQARCKTLAPAKLISLTTTASKGIAHTTI